ncbi:MAG: tyrosine-type recombinase/integrase [Bradyrhizobium sp.]|nr:tyrosine-type recombinase/integrase [Bradyrhizobium sp.]
MGTITARKRKDGTTAHLAQVLIKRGGAILHREARTFDRRQAAAAWLERREKELAAPGGLDQEKGLDPVLSNVIERYVSESKKEVGRTKAQVLNAIKGYEIAQRRCSPLDSTDLVEFANQLVSKVQPQTVSNYLSHLAAIFAIARPAWGYPLDQAAMKDAFVVAKRLGITSKSRTRERRPSLAELDLLMQHFGERQQRRPSSVPMQKVIAFAIFSTRRLEEITRLRRADLDEVGSKILVRDMKNPGEKLGNDVWCDLPAEALHVAQSMPSDTDEIFPYTTDAIGMGFTRACQLLGIVDLHFHDLRHDGVSRLFEMGHNVPQVAAVSGHRSWSSLKRYTHLRQTGNKYEGWKWLEVVTVKTAPG